MTTSLSRLSTLLAAMAASAFLLTGCAYDAMPEHRDELEPGTSAATLGPEEAATLGSTDAAILGDIAGGLCSAAVSNLGFSDDIMEQLEDTVWEPDRVCAGNSPAAGSDECRYHCDQCRGSTMGSLGNILGDLNSVVGSLGGGPTSDPAVAVVADVIQRIWDLLYGLCVADRGASRCNSVADMTAAMNHLSAATGMASCVANLINFAGQLIATARPLFDASAPDYGYLNDAWYTTLAKLFCNGFSTVTSCMGSVPAGGEIGDMVSELDDLMKGNPLVAAVGITCDTAMACNSAMLCEATRIACQFQDQIAARPADGFTEETGYSRDLFCCCDVGGAWSIMEEHRCLDQGHSFRPGTCSGGDLATRQSYGVPTTAAECQAFDDDPQAWRDEHPLPGHGGGDPGVDPHHELGGEPGSGCNSGDYGDGPDGLHGTTDFDILY